MRVPEENGGGPRFPLFCLVLSHRLSVTQPDTRSLPGNQGWMEPSIANCLHSRPDGRPGPVQVLRATPLSTWSKTAGRSARERIHKLVSRLIRVRHFHTQKCIGVTTCRARSFLLVGLAAAGDQREPPPILPFFSLCMTPTPRQRRKPDSEQMAYCRGGGLCPGPKTLISLRLIGCSRVPLRIWSPRSMSCALPVMLSTRRRLRSTDRRLLPCSSLTGRSSSELVTSFQARGCSSAMGAGSGAG